MSNKNQKAAASKAAASKNTGAPGKNASHAAQIMEKMGIDTIFENDKGEFFTSKNLAMLSVGQDAKKLTTHHASIIPAPPVDPSDGEAGGEDETPGGEDETGGGEQ